MAGGAAVSAFAAQAGGVAPRHAALGGRRGRGRRHAGGRADDEYRLQANAEGIRDYRALAERLGSTPGVRAVAPAIYQTVLLSAGGRARGIVLKGIDPELESRSDEALRRVV